jgi:hypothetical protein
VAPVEPDGVAPLVLTVAPDEVSPVVLPVLAAPPVLAEEELASVFSTILICEIKVPATNAKRVAKKKPMSASLLVTSKFFQKIGLSS